MLGSSLLYEGLYVTILVTADRFELVIELIELLKLVTTSKVYALVVVHTSQICDRTQ
jgi:hypothetical protein